MEYLWKAYVSANAQACFNIQEDVRGHGCEIVGLSYYSTLKFGASTALQPKCVKFQNDRTILNTNCAASRLSGFMFRPLSITRDLRGIC